IRNGSPALTRKTETSIPKLRNHRRAQSDIVASTSAFTTALSTLLTISNMDLSPTACNSCDPSKLDVFQPSACWKTRRLKKGGMDLAAMGRGGCEASAVKSSLRKSRQCLISETGHLCWHGKFTE